MENTLSSVLFGTSVYDPPWYQYDCCTVKEVSEDACKILEMTVGLSSNNNAQGFDIIEHDSWAALVEYLKWCEKQQGGIEWRVNKIYENDTDCVRHASHFLHTHCRNTSFDTQWTSLGKEKPSSS